VRLFTSKYTFSLIRQGSFDSNPVRNHQDRNEANSRASQGNRIKRRAPTNKNLDLRWNRRRILQNRRRGRRHVDFRSPKGLELHISKLLGHQQPTFPKIPVQGILHSSELQSSIQSNAEQVFRRGVGNCAGRYMHWVGDLCV
jgi:hypothetical protein